MIATTTKTVVARRNGARSHGPVTAAGKARSAQNARSHGVCARTLVLTDPTESAMLAELRAVLLARWQPFDAAEAHLVEELVFTAWRQLRLRLVEDAVLARAQHGEPASPELPSLPTLIRYRGRLDRDARHAQQELLELRRGRDRIAEPLQLRWLAERIDHARAIAAAYPPSSQPVGDVGTNEPTPPDADRLPPVTDGMDDAAGAGSLASGMNEPRHPVPPLPPQEPGRTVTSLNRHRRRRRAALARLALRAAA